MLSYARMNGFWGKVTATEVNTPRAITSRWILQTTAPPGSARRIGRGEVKAHLGCSVRNCSTSLVLCAEKLSSPRGSHVPVRRDQQVPVKNVMTFAWCGGRPSCRAPRRSSHPRRHTATECHDDSIRSRPLGAAWRQRQRRIEPVQRFNRRFFVHADDGSPVAADSCTDR